MLYCMHTVCAKVDVSFVFKHYHNKSYFKRKNQFVMYTLSFQLFLSGLSYEKQPTQFLRVWQVWSTVAIRVSSKKCVSQGGKVRFAGGGRGGGVFLQKRSSLGRQTAVGMKGRKLSISGFFWTTQLRRQACVAKALTAKCRETLGYALKLHCTHVFQLN